MLKIFLFKSVLLTSIFFNIPVYANCNISAPKAMAFNNDNGSCPSGYYSSGNSCVPSSSSSSYAFLNQSGSCPSGYYASGNSCVASSSSCHAFYNAGGSCPSGYYASGNSCVAN